MTTTYLQRPIELGAPIDVSFNLNATRLIERSTQFTSPSGTVDSEEYAGEWGFPEWQCRGRYALNGTDGPSLGKQDSSMG